MKPATEYGRLIVVRRGIVNCIRIRLFDSDEDNCFSQLVWMGNLHIPTDQTETYQSTDSRPINFYDEVWFEGVCLYRKHWLFRLFRFLDRG